MTCLLRGAGTPRLVESGATLRSLDLTNVQQVSNALAGIDTVIHCAYDWNDTAWNYAALRTLMTAFRRNGCRRFVYLSSFVVYQIPDRGEVTEASVEDASSSGYANTKRQLESELLRAAREESFPVAILQPTIVYGPFSRPWTIDPAEELRNRSVILPDTGDGTCNAVFVDDVVNAMILAAEREQAIGERFLISGPKPVTWKEFYDGVAVAAGVDGPEYLPAQTIARESGKIRKLMRLAADPRRLAQRGPIRKALRAALLATPRPTRLRLQELLFGNGAPNQRQQNLPSRDRILFLQSTATIKSEKAQRLLGYSPRYDFTMGIDLTEPFLKRHMREVI